MNELTFLTKVLKVVGWLSTREIRRVWVYQRQGYRPTAVATKLRPRAPSRRCTARTSASE